MAQWAGAALDSMGFGGLDTKRRADETGVATTFAKPSSALSTSFSSGFSPSRDASAMIRRPDPTFNTASSLLSGGNALSNGFGRASSLLSGGGSSSSGGFTRASSLLGAGPSYGSSARASSLIGGPQSFTKASSLLMSPQTQDAAQSMGAAAAGNVGIGGTLNNRDWSTLDGMNGGIAAAAAQTGVPANLIKAMLMREGGGGRDKNVSYIRGANNPIYAFNGMSKEAADWSGVDFNRMTQDDNYAIYAMGAELAHIKSANGLGSWEDTAAYYFAGSNYNKNWTDELGNTVQSYLYDANGGVVSNWKALDAAGGGGGASTTWGTTDGRGVTVSGNASTVIAKAQEYLGTPYVWGGTDPSTGWDCSGMTWWLDQHYGNGQLPQGSHQQMQYAQQTGQFFQDQSQLQAGDLLFFDTGDDYASNINRASHVGMYLGNGQFINAANPSVGTVVYNMASFGGYLGAMHQSWSGGSSSPAYGIGQAAVAGLGSRSTGAPSMNSYQSTMSRLLGILHGTA